MTSPPCPPSPPDGPPKGTYFSRRKAEQPLPPRPPVTCRSTSSTNAVLTFRAGRRRASLRRFGRQRDDGDELAPAPAVAVLDVAGRGGEQGVVLAASDVAARLDGRAALADEDLAAL